MPACGSAECASNANLSIGLYRLRPSARCRYHAAIFAVNGSYASPQTYVGGIIPAVAVGAAVVAAAAVLAMALPRMMTGLRTVKPLAIETSTEGEAAALAA